MYVQCVKFIIMSVCQYNVYRLYLSVCMYYISKVVVITPNPTRDLEFIDTLIGAGIYMFQWGKAP